MFVKGFIPCGFGFSPASKSPGMVGPSKTGVVTGPGGISLSVDMFSVDMCSVDMVSVDSVECSVDSVEYSVDSVEYSVDSVEYSVDSVEYSVEYMVLSVNISVDDAGSIVVVN